MSRAAKPPEITPDLVLQAYSIGLFPMAESAEQEHLFWVDPEARGIFPLDGLIVSKSLAKMVRSDRYEIRIDSDFDAVIEGCAAPAAERGQTWINGPIRRLYRMLFDRGDVHTVEAWREGMLVGGLYGVSLGAAFFGESMFHRSRDASKVALVHLVARLRRGGFRLLDTQFVTPHLESLGAVEVPRARYKALLEDAVSASADRVLAFERGALSGADALAALHSPQRGPAGSGSVG
jgi:leucyl/phenylalanyl-tRNA---protein transferase